MTLEALAEKTWKTQRMLLMPVLFIGVVPLIIGLVVGIPLVTGLGVAFIFAGGIGLRRLRAKADEFNALLANPSRVRQSFRSCRP